MDSCAGQVIEEVDFCCEARGLFLQEISSE
jgi:hypothetical protein